MILASSNSSPYINEKMMVESLLWKRNIRINFLEFGPLLTLFIWREGIRGQTDWNLNQKNLANLITWTTALSNSVKLSHAVWGHPRWMGHGGEVWQNVVYWRREWQTTSVFLPWEPHEQYERQNDRTLKEELLGSVGAQYATGDEWRNNSRKNEGMEPSKNNTQLWMRLVIEVKSNAVKSNIA